MLCTLLSWDEPPQKPMTNVLGYYNRCLQQLQLSTARLERELPAARSEQLKELFSQTRHSYKKIEWLVEYLYPSTATKLNGPALPEAEPSEPEEMLLPSGFQVMEEKLYGDAIDDAVRQELVYDLATITNRVRYLQAQVPGITLSESEVLDAVKLNLYRLIAKGLAGFDTPVSLTAIAEIAPTLQSADSVLSFFPKAVAVHRQIKKAIVFVHGYGLDFNQFNRAVFITAHLNPICKTLTAFQAQQQIPFTASPRAVRPKASTLFEAKALDPLFYAPSGTTTATPQQLLLGRMLFAEPLLSSTGNRSCRSCHQPDKAFSDGLKVNTVLGSESGLLRNSPSLWNASLQPVQFWDSRIAFLEDQVHDVVSSRQEMGGLFEGIVQALQSKPTYRKRFASAFGGAITADKIRTALAGYVRSLVAMNSAFDNYMRGNEKALSAEQLRGFNIFMGKGKCGTCHFLPTFSGAVPPLYDKMESEVLGVPATADTLHPVLDNDSGKYAVYKIPHHLRSFKTPTLRNVALTAPYMHNGVYNTLEEVVNFYDHGGGAGLGFDLPNQTLPPDKLNLTQQEKAQLIAFLHSLTDASIRK